MNKISDLKSAKWWRLSKMGLLLTLMMASVFLTACATAPGSSGNFMAERAQDRWDALLGGDYAIAYSYYSPGYRSSVSVVDFEIEIRTRRVQWVSAEYMDHSCDESVCTVQFKLGYKVAQPVAGIPVWESFDTIDEKWVKTEDQWWYLPKK